MMLRPQGYATLIDPDSGMTERDTFTCAHCNMIQHVKPRAHAEDIGGLCKACMGLICATCVGGKCVPYLEKVDQLERAIARGREVGRWWECS